MMDPWGNPRDSRCLGFYSAQIYLCGRVCGCGKAREVGKIRYLLMKEARVDHTPRSPAVRTT